MPSKNDKIAVELATKVVGKWNDTYQWIPTLGAFATIAMAFSVGANNLPAPFSTSIGSGALTLLKASIMACAIYIPGAASASNSRTVDALFSDFLKESQPTEGFLMWSMVVVLLTTTTWLTLATYLELPVSSQQSIHAAMLGTMLVTQGFDYLPLWNKNENHDFNSGGLLWIFLEWTLAPSIACLCAWFLFVVLKSSILRRENAKKRILVFLPIDYGISAGLLCFVIVSQVIGNYVDVNRLTVMIAVAGSALIGAVLSSVISTFIVYFVIVKLCYYPIGFCTQVVVVPLAIKKLATTKNHRNSMENDTSMKQESEESRGNQGCSNGAKVDDDVLEDFMQMRVLETVYEEEERSCGSLDVIQEPEQVQPGDNTSSEQSTPFKQLLKSTPNRLLQTQNFQRIEKTTTIENVIKYIRDTAKSTFSPVLEYDRRTLVRHALAENFDDIEDCFSFPLLLASCMVALIQSTTEIASIMNPYVAILDVFEHRSKYSSEDVGHLQVKWWYGGIGGLVAGVGFLLCGWRLTQCLGGKLTYMSNSRGWASQLTTVAAMIIVAKVKLPVSSVQAFIGFLVGVGVADDRWNVNWKLVCKIMCGWIMTVILCRGIAYMMFSASMHTPAYAVP
ncbi:phosphate-repressible phosphate permease pho-4 isoform X1 [Gossypium raimondii]|uniref:phosphate-repressible phosphate permease pho-4 isoform X1 n=1 Tax=Gossypium raimondii TaxID=29730 RepID=UPI00227A6D64|nr:phosphate-repressible phosphate permease pho-4 isoform X1 [Gossypium raimondii]